MSEQTAQPCWYELGTTDLDAAADFYTAVLGLQVVPIGGPDFDYRIASDADGNGVAGLTGGAGQEGATAPSWVTYIAVTDCDAKVAEAVEQGGSVIKPPADIPGTGRFAVLADPRGAVFALLQPMPRENPAVGAFDQARPGHGNWHELCTHDPAADLGFYEDLFGWARSQTLDMGEHGPYIMFNAGEPMIGGAMNLLDIPSPSWLMYFGSEKVGETAERITAAGGTITAGPSEVPGGGWIIVARDPQGARFGVVGQQL